MEEEGEEGKGEEEENKQNFPMRSVVGVVDVEDMGKVLHRAKVRHAGGEVEIRRRVERREMVTPLLRKTSLNKVHNANDWLHLARQGNVACNCTPS